MSIKRFTYSAGCHCKSVRFDFTLHESIEDFTVLACNCSMCEKFGYLHIIIAKKQVQFHTQASALTKYQFNTKVAKHYFCKTCGVKSFYQPRSHPDCWSINARCLDDFANLQLKVKGFDGKNWEQNIQEIQ